MNSNNVLTTLLDVDLPSGERLFLVNGPEEVQYGGRTYLPYPFTLTILDQQHKNVLESFSSNMDSE